MQSDAGSGFCGKKFIHTFQSPFFGNWINSLSLGEFLLGVGLVLAAVCPP